MGAIEDFIVRYRKEFDYYDQSARLAAQVLESNLKAAGVRAIVTSRAKALDSLERKVRERDSALAYPSADAIFENVVDLAGVRVALYFPGQRDQVDATIRKLFNVQREKRFPEEAAKPKYEKLFRGYYATHYRATLQTKSLAEAQHRYSEARLEIQVASILMHAWSEVEHDLVYKPLQGTLSDDEYAILDELNGMVLAGEIALKRLQASGNARVVAGERRFGNHYELAAFLLSKAGLTSEKAMQQGLGAVDLLFELLARLGLDTPDLLAPYVNMLHGDLEKRPIAAQIVDQILAEDEARYPVYDELRASRERLGASPPNDIAPERDEALGFFMQRWIDYEKTIRKLFPGSALGKDRGPPVPGPAILEDRGLIDGAIRQGLEPIRALRNDVVHGLFSGDADELTESGRRLEALTKSIREQHPNLVRTEPA